MSVQLLLLDCRLSSLSTGYTVIILITLHNVSPFSGFHIFLFVDLLLHFSWTYPPVNSHRGKGPREVNFWDPESLKISLSSLPEWEIFFHFKAMALFSLHFSFVLQVSNVILISGSFIHDLFYLKEDLGFFFFLYSYSESFTWYPIIWAFITLGDFHGKKFKFQYFKIFSLGSFSFLYTLLQKC